MSHHDICSFCGAQGHRPENCPWRAASAEGWEIIEHNGLQHVLPVGELEHHQSRECKCTPELDEEYNVVIHNSFDGRERFERGERKPS